MLINYSFRTYLYRMPKPLKTRCVPTTDHKGVFGQGAKALRVGIYARVDDRYQRRSTILTSQLPVAKWHIQIGDPTLADSILDRLVHNAHCIELQGESMRKKRARKAVASEEVHS